ncbi:MAG: 50S ribosomal protein L11 methyltransferase [Bacteroidota bacterium]
MNELYVEVVLNPPAEDALRELLSFQLYELGFTGFLENSNGLHCYIPKQLWNDTLQNELRALLNNERPSPITISSIAEIQNQNWNRQWEESIQPVKISEKIIITPSWHSVPENEGKIVLVIDPKMSFGTGYHESTRLMLRMMERYVTPRSFVLDVGTGTGVLAIAAVKLGSRFAIGVDIDEWSQVNARENVERNGCANRVDIRLGSLETVKELEFDFILANITRGRIIELLPSMIVKLGKNGMFLLSGLLTDDEAIIEKALRQNACTLLSSAKENEWISVAAQKM